MHDTNLVNPSLATAMRGFQAIKEYFDHMQKSACNQKNIDDEYESNKLAKSENEVELTKSETKKAVSPRA